MNTANQASFQTTDQKVSGSNPDGCATHYQWVTTISGGLKKVKPCHFPATFPADPACQMEENFPAPNPFRSRFFVILLHSRTIFFSEVGW